MEAIKFFDFGQLIAFVLPGILVARACAYYLPSLQRAFDRASSGGEGTVGPLIWVLLAAATCGLTLSVVRQQWVDPVFGRIYGWSKEQHSVDGVDQQVTRPPWRPNYRALRASKEIRALFEGAVAQVYRYYQFVTNTSVAVGTLAVARWNQRALMIASGKSVDSLSLAVTWAMAITSVALLLTSYQQFLGWCRVHNQITEVQYEAGTKTREGAAAKPANAQTGTAATETSAKSDAPKPATT